MPSEVTLDLVIPPELGDPDQIRSELRQRVADVEQSVLSERAASGAPVSRTGGTDPDRVGQSDPAIGADQLAAISDVDVGRSGRPIGSDKRG